MVKSKHFVPRIKPLYFINEDEIRKYISLKKFKILNGRCPYASLSYRDEVRALLDKFEESNKGTKNSIVNSFLEILPLLKKHYKNSKDINVCSICSEPCIGEVCKACEVIRKVG
ncbi:MAG: TIGR00269 family protein [Nanoarchaeota archaeon]